jgi:RimJ/RimL family protein N-acetyltransferase
VWKAERVEQKPLPCPQLSDALVRLRPFADNDIDPLVRACADPLIPKFTYWPSGLTPDQAMERLDWAEHGRLEGTRLELAVADPGSDELLGFIGLAPDWRDMRASLFYWTASWARGRGVARRALELLADWAFHELALGRLELETDADNVASQRVAEAAGFQREGTLRSRHLRLDGRCDSIVYGRLH